MKISFILLAASALTFSTYANEGYVVKGIIHGDYAGYIYLSFPHKKDSSLVRNHTFEFSGKVDKPVLAWLNLKPLANAAYLYLENSLITVEGDFSTTIQQNEKINLYTITSITGSYAQNLLDQYRAFCKRNRPNENFNSLRYEELKVMFANNPKQPVNGWILSDLAATNPVYTYDELRNLYLLLDTAAMQRTDLNMIKTGLRTINKYGIGQPFTFFQLPNQKGEIIHSTKLSGKIVLIDFWASWCKPCRAKYPDMVSLYRKYQHQNFDILSISIDENKISWINAIQTDGLIWNNVLDQKKETQQEFGIQAIPFSYLIDEQGIIIAINPTIEEIDSILKEK